MRRRGDALDPSAGRRPWRRPAGAPDVTGDVMRRLGLPRASAPAARRRRLRRGVLRGAICAAAVIAAVAAVKLERVVVGPAAAPGPTIPSAIRHDVAQHGGTIDRAIRSIRSLAPAWRDAPATGGDPPRTPRPDAT